MVAHTEDGRIVNGMALPHVQVVRTTYSSLEPTIGFDREGRAFVPAVSSVLGEPYANGAFVPTVLRVARDGSSVAAVGPADHAYTEDPYSMTATGASLPATGVPSGAAGVALGLLTAGSVQLRRRQNQRAR